MIRRIEQEVPIGPGKMVPAGEKFSHRLWKGIDDFRGQIADRRFFLGHPVSCQPVQIHPGLGGSAGLHSLGHQAGNQTGEHISHPAGGHTRIAGGIDENGPVRPGHHRGGSFEHEMHLMPFGKGACMADAVILNRCC